MQEPEARSQKDLIAHQDAKAQRVEVDDGGPAFPVVTDLEVMDPGMSLRDWFAGLALAVYRPLDGDWTPRELAELAYQQADEMIAEMRRREAAENE